MPFDQKLEKLNNREFKQSLAHFKQVFKVLENFKGADLSKMQLSMGLRDKIYITDKGKELDYNVQ